MKTVKIGLEVEVPDEVPGVVAIQNLFHAASHAAEGTYYVVQAYGLAEKDKEKELLRKERDEVVEYARSLEEKMRLLVESRRHPATEAEWGECKRLGCKPENWASKCPLHGAEA